MENLGSIRFFFTIDQKFIPAIKAFLADDETFPYTQEFLEWAEMYVPTEAWTSLYPDQSVFLRVGCTEDDPRPGKCEITDQWSDATVLYACIE